MAKKNKSGKRRNATPKPAISKKNKLNVRQNSNNSSILYQFFFYAVLFSIAANYYGQLENVSQGYIKTEWLKIPVVLNEIYAKNGIERVRKYFKNLNFIFSKIKQIY